MSIPALTARDLKRRKPSLMWIASALWIGLLLLFVLSSDGEGTGALGNVFATVYGACFTATVLVHPVLRRVGYALSLLAGVLTGIAIAADAPGMGAVAAFAVLALVLGAVTVLFAAEGARDEDRRRVLEPWPGASPPLSGGLGFLVTGWLLGSFAAVAFVASVITAVHERHRESSASVRTGTVERVLDDHTLFVSLGDRPGHRVDVRDASDWRVGESDTFWVDAHGPFRSTDEPFDASPGLGISAAFVALGVALVVRGRSARARPEAYPVHRVRVAPWGAGMVVLPADGSPQPLASVAVVTHTPSATTEDWRRDDFGEEALVYGLPRRGAPVLVRTRDALLIGTAL